MTIGGTATALWLLLSKPRNDLSPQLGPDCMGVTGSNQFASELSCNAEGAAKCLIEEMYDESVHIEGDSLVRMLRSFT